MTTWPLHIQEWNNCQRCPLAQQRSTVCLARSEWPAGSDIPNLRLPCDVLLVGEAPGMSEDTVGYPFVGPAGQHLDTIISHSLPQGVAIALTNLVACYPREAKDRGDHQPEYSEIIECRPRLIEFVNIAQPRLIVRVGKLAAQYLGTNDVQHVDIEHPASILRMPNAQKGMATQRCIVQLRNAWLDVLQLPKRQWKEWGNAETKKEWFLGRDPDEIPF